MKQIIQNYRTGELELAEVPIPVCSSNKILVRNMASLISIGTERSIIELGQKSLLGKAKARPDLVKRFMDKAKKEGFIKTFKEALGRLDNPTPLGYSSAGIVIEVGNNVHKFSPGDRVACIGAGYASHAEYITVPEMLCAKIPKIVNRYKLYDFKGEEELITNNESTDNYISFEEASFGMLGIIALHGIRCAKLTFGESVAVIGLGLLGLLTVQILKAYGCKVIGMDIDLMKVELAKKLGTDYVFISDDEFKNGVEKATSGYGTDAVIITAATKSDAPVNTAVDIARYGGRIVLVGVADIHPQRNEMWHKEVEIIVSKAGGPGTFDPFYENKGVDYPFGYVRWTENRNLEEFLRLVAEGKIDVKSLISHRFKIEQAETVYKDILDNRGGPYIGVVLEYPNQGHRLEVIGDRSKNLKPKTHSLSPNTSQVSVGVIGAGLFGKALLLPAFKKIKDIRFHTLSTSSGANTYHTARKYGFENCTTDYKEVINNPEINSIVVLTPHSLHARMVIEASKAGKHVFVEKPLCINEQEFRDIIATYNSQLITNNCFLMVGYNRRFSPHAVKASEYLKDRQDPMVINYRINAGYVPPDHWVHSEEEGGSRIVGEVCHFVDMTQFLTRSNPIRVYGERISGNNKTALNSDNVAITLKFEDGSVGNIIYSASGDKAFSREQIEVFCEGKTIVIRDYKETNLFYAGKRKSFKTFNQEMGYKEELQHFFDVVSGRVDLKLTPDEIFSSTLTVFKINDALDKAKPVEIAL
ncbi:MAG: bi-domain-containing oxidoreductase [Thermodesulfovibrionales bacterium]|nr:bi-domain-containing oxidoreductase [Thermodesulfovibrionales bacterium]